MGLPEAGGDIEVMISDKDNQPVDEVYLDFDYHSDRRQNALESIREVQKRLENMPPPLVENSFIQEATTTRHSFAELKNAADRNAYRRAVETSIALNSPVPGRRSKNPGHISMP